MQNGATNGAAASSKPAKQGAIEKMYQKKSQLEHILLRPDTYIGSVERITDSMWVVEKKVAEESGDISYKMVQREISYVPGLYKIFDEILVNAAGKLLIKPFLKRHCTITTLYNFR
jgi:DNA topoisomerase II